MFSGVGAPLIFAPWVGQRRKLHDFSKWWMSPLNQRSGSIARHWCREFLSFRRDVLWSFRGGDDFEFRAFAITGRS
jgi:hypothetical protein